MDPEQKQLLQETHALVKENHRMLRALRRHQIYSFVGTIILWAVLLLLPLYLYQQYLQPLVSSADIQNLINFYKGQ